MKETGKERDERERGEWREEREEERERREERGRGEEGRVRGVRLRGGYADGGTPPKYINISIHISNRKSTN